uniref:zinc finger protein 431-like isoform X2 n=1 Tax=Maylandia zebra TaxID=106582 RepID=UPI000D309AB5|nr:zinc finger protein 431-like isoform X2 [Maylandia zebra]
MFTHTEERPYQCDLCEKTFKSPCYLRQHQQIHTRKRLYKCSYCEQSDTDGSSSQPCHHCGGAAVRREKHSRHSGQPRQWLRSKVKLVGAHHEIRPWSHSKDHFNCLQNSERPSWIYQSHCKEVEVPGNPGTPKTAQ